MELCGWKMKRGNNPSFFVKMIKSEVNNVSEIITTDNSIITKVGATEVTVTPEEITLSVQR